MIVFPNAKINLGLDILRKRPDGYHDISTVMVPVGWKDILEIVPSEGCADNLSVSGRGVACPPGKNLVMKAVNALRKVCDFPAIDIHLHKVIPDGAGLGGGSADASFTLTAINSLFDLNLSISELENVAAEIGSDCPFFIDNCPKLCVGTGTTLLPIDFHLSSPLYIVIVKPPVSVPTKDAYSHVSPSVPDYDLGSKLVNTDVVDWHLWLKNDFERSVFPSYPEIKRIKDLLSEAGAIYSSMSGSGSSVFGLFENDILADNAARKFEGCDIFVGLFDF